MSHYLFLHVLYLFFMLKVFITLAKLLKMKHQNLGHSTFIFCHCKLIVISHAKHILNLTRNQLLSFFPLRTVHFRLIPSAISLCIICTSHFLSSDVLICCQPPAAPPTVPSDVAGGVDMNSYPRPTVTRKAKVLYDYDILEKNELSFWLMRYDLAQLTGTESSS